MIQPLMMLADQAERFDSSGNKQAMFFYLAKIMEHVAEMLRDHGKDGDQADQLAFVISEYSKEPK